MVARHSSSTTVRWSAGLSIESRSSTICIDLSMHVHVVKNLSVINLYINSIIIMYIQCRSVEMRINKYNHYIVPQTNI